MKIIICDDNAKERGICHARLSEIAARNGIDIAIDEYSSGENLLFELEDKKNEVDILFLDIAMLRMNGIETAKSLRKLKCTSEIIFLTHSTAFAIDAFDVDALHYIVKDSRDCFDRLESVFMKAVEVVNEKEQEYIMLTGVGESRNIAVKSIKYFEVVRDIIVVHYNAETFEFVTTLSRLENLLFTKGFIRTHRSFLVSKNYIKSVSYENIKLYDGDLLPVGRKYYASIKKSMEKAVNKESANT